MKKRINNMGENRAASSLTLAPTRGLYYQEPEDSVDRDSWLRSILEPDPNKVQRQFRALCSELFLKKILYPLAEREASFNERMVADLLINYKKSLTVPGGDFEISNVIGSLLSRFQCYSDEESNVLTEQQSFMEKDIYLFTALSELDLQAIDRLVEEHLEVRPEDFGENIE